MLSIASIGEGMSQLVLAGPGTRHHMAWAKRAILLVIFDERSSLGLVRLRVKRASSEMERIFEAMTQKTEAGTGGDKQNSPFAEITDEDIDALFSD